MAIEMNRFETATTLQPADCTGDTLIIPCVSIGSIPQLAIDALLAPVNSQRLFGQKAQLIGRLDHRYCVPFLGGSSHFSNRAQDDSIDNSKHQFEGPLQLYRFDQSKVTILQQRSPILKSLKDTFVKDLMDWVQRKKFANVLFLTSLDAGLRSDAQMNSAFWYVDISQQDSTSPIQSKIRSTLPIYEKSSTSSTLSRNISSLPSMPSGGLARTYLEAAQVKLNTIQVQAIITFAAEGDNRHDALELAALISTLLGVSELNAEQFSQPTDWNLLFGPETVNTGMFT